MPRTDWAAVRAQRPDNSSRGPTSEFSSSPACSGRGRVATPGENLHVRGRTRGGGLVRSYVQVRDKASSHHLETPDSLQSAMRGGARSKVRRVVRQEGLAEEVSSRQVPGRREAGEVATPGIRVNTPRKLHREGKAVQGLRQGWRR